jgi:predicted phage terminase large subunit-like protein
MSAEAGFLDFAIQALSADLRTPARHHRLLIKQLQDVADGGCDRLMVHMPPGAAKSTYSSILFPAYFFSRQPGRQIIATSHTASLANYFGRCVRNTIIEHGGILGVSLAKDSRASGHFFLEDGGEYFAAGVRGPITGRRADLVLIDDPVKSFAEAESLVFRDALYDWYRAELSARLKPNGSVVLVMTRWHEDDLSGRLMRGDDGWRCLTLPALAGPADPLGRQLGEALWPEWQSEAAIARRRLEVGERTFAALYQQSPRAPDSALFNTKTIEILAEAPAMDRTIRAWDLAATIPGTGRDPDYTVGLKLGVNQRFEMVVLDIVRFRGSPSEVEARILATAKADGPATMIALPQDPGQAGVAQIAMLKPKLEAFRVEASAETGSKVMRAMPTATQIDKANLSLVAAPWNDSFLSELSVFPDSPKDDQVDALSRAVNTLLTTSMGSARRLSIPLMGR